MADTDRQILLHLGRDLRRVVDAADVYYLEAMGQVTKVRLRPARELRDTRSLGEMVRVLGAFGMVRVHRNHAVNLRHVVEIRRRDTEADWELVLEAPVNRVLPVGRTYLAKLWAAFGEGRAAAAPSGHHRRRGATGRRRSSRSSRRWRSDPSSKR